MGSIPRIRNFQAVSGIKVAVFLVIALCLIGAFALFYGAQEGTSDRYGAATPEEAVTAWVTAYNANDWAGSIDYTVLHFSPAAVRQAQSSGLGELTTTLAYDNLTVISRDSLTEKKRTHIDKELLELDAQMGSPGYTNYSVVRYDFTVNGNFGWDSQGTQYCLVMEIEGRWFRTFIVMEEWEWAMWEEGWYTPTYHRSVGFVMNDSNVWQMMLLDVPANITWEQLGLNFHYNVGGDIYYCLCSFRPGDPSYFPAIHERMTEEQVENAYHYQVGYVDVEDDGLVSAGDHLYLVMDRSSGDNAMLPTGTTVYYQIGAADGTGSDGLTLLGSFEV